MNFDHDRYFNFKKCLLLYFDVDKYFFIIEMARINLT
jgi:hypothetical protein